jgi:predicted SnoaL-like aldol condensation-catalyzing enzyme
MSTRKAIAADFLAMVCSGKVREAYDRHVAPDFRHHNGYFPGDRQSLLDAMDENAREHPGKAVEVKRVIEEGDTVVAFSHMKPQPGHEGFAIVHIFRFEGDKVVELWDVAQELPADSPNRNGMF